MNDKLSTSRTCQGTRASAACGANTAAATRSCCRRGTERNPCTSAALPISRAPARQEPHSLRSVRASSRSQPYRFRDFKPEHPFQDMLPCFRLSWLTDWQKIKSLGKHSWGGFRGTFLSGLPGLRHFPGRSSPCMWSQSPSGPASKKTTPPQRSVRAMAAKAVLLQSAFSKLSSQNSQICFNIFHSSDSSPWSNSYKWSPHDNPNNVHELGAYKDAFIGFIEAALSDWRIRSSLESRGAQATGEREREREREREKEREREGKRERQRQDEPIEYWIYWILRVSIFVVKKVLCVCARKPTLASWCVVRYLRWKHHEARLLGLVGNALLTKADEGFPGTVWKSKRW